MSSVGTRNRTLALTIAICIVGVLPAYLVGSLAVPLGANLSIGPAGIGIAAASFFATSGLLARCSGAAVHVLGSQRGLLLAAGLSASSLGGIGIAANFVTLIAALILGGLANSLAQPSANLRLAELISDRHLGLAFGLKQAAVPAATLFCGVAVSAAASFIGWRDAFWSGGAIAVLLLSCIALAREGIPYLHEPAGAGDERRAPNALTMLTFAAGFAAAASAPLGVFLIPSAIATGMTASRAGILFAISSLIGLIVRIALGWAADRHPRSSQYLVMARLLTFGSFGYVLLALGGPLWFVMGSLVSYGAGWTWPGLMHFVVVRRNKAFAASATGRVQTGLSLGAASGPLTFGLIADTVSYRCAWLVMAGLSLVAMMAVAAARRSIHLR